MAELALLEATYDVDGDVLYVSARRAPAARGEEGNDGIVWRFDAAGDVVGAIVVGFEEAWSTRRGALDRTLARRFDVRPQDVSAAVDNARSPPP